jgi:Leucine-rich repeat (LRR) protein
VPVWPQDKGPCGLLTLKMRQNSLEELIGIEMMKSIEELDLSDNFITRTPEQIRYLPLLKRVRTNQLNSYFHSQFLSGLFCT